MTKKVTFKQLMESDDFDNLLQKVPFEHGMELLEDLVTQVEGGEMPLEGAIGSYEKGTLLLNHLRSLLTGAEEKLEVIKAKA